VSGDGEGRGRGLIQSRSVAKRPGIGMWVYSDGMGVRINSRFVTTEETAKILGVPPRRVRELKKLMDANEAAGRHLRTISSRSRDGVKAPSVAFKFKRSDSGSARNGSPNRSKTRRGTQKRGKRSKIAR
jgi:hypothetical protein